MTKSHLKDLAELLGIVAIVASLIFVGMQLRQDLATALSGTSQSAASNYIELQIAIAEHAESLSKSNRGDDLTEQEMTALNALVRGMHRQAVTDVLERRRLGGGAIVPQAIFVSWLHRNSGAKRIWLSQNLEVTQDLGRLIPFEGVSRTFYEEIRKALDELENGEI